MFFDPNLIEKLEYLARLSRRVFHGRLLTRQRSLRRGGGVEFAEHRDYVFGDELRYLDWNIFARLKTRLIKRFEEEDDLYVYCLIDSSSSMSFSDGQGGLNKYAYACHIAAALAYIALSEFDRVGIAILADRVQSVFPPVRGKGHILSLLRFMESYEAGDRTTNLAASIEEFLHSAPRPGLVLLLSDMLDPAGYSTALELLQFRHFEPYVIQINHPLELKPNLRGDIELLDMETGLREQVTISETILAAYTKAFSDYLASLKACCLKKGFRCSIASTSVPFDEQIIQMMVEMNR